MRRLRNVWTGSWTVRKTLVHLSTMQSPGIRWPYQVECSGLLFFRGASCDVCLNEFTGLTLELLRDNPMCQMEHFLSPWDLSHVSIW